tara:strand:- start:775 stop:1689 length:915 start_codon:yes stop_codon:yes gene_type:complete
LRKKIKILIPGGTGFIGFHLALFLKNKGWNVHSLSKYKPKKKRKIKGIKYIYCNVDDIKKLENKIDTHYDYIVNLSGYVDHSDKSEIISSHFNGCKNLASLFLKTKIKKFIQIGSSVEYGKIKSPQKENKKNLQKTFSFYGKAKLMSTKFLLNLKKKYSFPVTILRLYLVYGPYQDTNRIIPFTIMNALKNKRFKCSTGNQLRDFLYIDDLIEIIFKILNNDKSNGEILNVGSGIPISVKKLIIKICKLSKGGNPEFGKINFRKDELLKLYPNLSKLKKITNWHQKISLEKGLKRTIKYYKEFI